MREQNSKTQYKVYWKMIIGTLVLICFSIQSNATIIRSSQITASTNLTVKNYEGMGPFAVEHITDGIMSDTPFYNGFISESDSGIIMLELDKEYDLDGFLLWNDVHIRGEGIRQFKLDFYDADYKLIKTVSNSTHNGIFTGAIYQLNSEKYIFDNVIKGVKTVNLVILSSNQLEIREVAFRGKPSIGKSVVETQINCSPWTMDKLIDSLKVEIASPENYLLSYSIENDFHNEINNYITGLNSDNSSIASLRAVVTTDIQNKLNQPTKEYRDSIFKSYEFFAKNKPENLMLYSFPIKVNHWVELKSSIDILDIKGNKLDVLSFDECINSSIYLRIIHSRKISQNEGYNVTIQLSNGKNIINSIKKYQIRKIKNKFYPIIKETDSNTISFTLLKDTGKLTFNPKEFDVTELEYPIHADVVHHAVFDDLRVNRYFLHTFNFVIPKRCKISQANFEIRLTNLGELYSNDGIYFKENGKIIYSIRIWKEDDSNNAKTVMSFNLDELANNLFRPLDSDISILSSLYDGDFSLAVQDDTSVDYVKLKISLIGDDCTINVQQ